MDGRDVSIGGLSSRLLAVLSAYLFMGAPSAGGHHSAHLTPRNR